MTRVTDSLPWTDRAAASERGRGALVNDVHSRLNTTRVARIVAPTGLDALRDIVAAAGRSGWTLSVAGGRHAMGGQQFGTGTVLVDSSRLSRILSFDGGGGRVEVEAGARWPGLTAGLQSLQANRRRQWGIAQKQTGADRLSLGGALSANIHGRGLAMQPLIADVESFLLVDGHGRVRACSRRENPELFALAIGGYGLFGMIYSVVLRLAPRRKLERVVEITEIDSLDTAFAERIAAGYLYGDFQFAIDERSPDFLRRGVFSCYRPVDPETPIPQEQKLFTVQDWQELLYLAHVDKRRAFERYSRHYLSTSGQIYWSDLHQLVPYLDDYHAALDRRRGARQRASEVIGELYVPRRRLTDFLDEVREDFRRHRVDLIYGTVRLIERDDESFLAWAREPWACVVFNLHTEHAPEGIEGTAASFRRLIDLARRRGGSFFLTYGRSATREQVEACYPQFREFLRLKRRYDPDERFQSDWYRHYRRLFGDHR